MCNVTAFWFEYPNGERQVNQHSSARAAIDEMADIDAAAAKHCKEVQS